MEKVMKYISLFFALGILFTVTNAQADSAPAEMICQINEGRWILFRAIDEDAKHSNNDIERVTIVDDVSIIQFYNGQSVYFTNTKCILFPNLEIRKHFMLQFNIGFGPIE